jgi:hypothetical protein
MLDYSAQGLYEVGTEVGVFQKPLPEAAKELSLATHYMGFIPAVGGVELTSVLAAREALKRPLVRFRALMAELAREVEASPVNSGFGHAADELFRRELAPQLQEIRDLARERGLGHLLLAEAVESKAGALAKAAIAIAATGAAGLPLAGQAGAGVAVLGAEIAAGVAKRRRDLEARREGHGLMWMYELERKLGSAAST